MKLLNRRFDLDKTFDRLTLGTVSVLTVIILLLLLALVFYSRLQTVSEDNSHELLAEVEELQETTSELQNTVDTLNQLPEDIRRSSELEDIEQRLDVIDETLEVIEENIFDMAPVMDDPIDSDGIPPSSQEIKDIKHNIIQIFLVIAYMISGLSIITAYVLFVAVTTRAKHRMSREH